VRRESILLPDDSAPKSARAVLDDTLPPQVLDGRLDELRLAITEVVTNAVVHGSLDVARDVIRLTIDVDGDGVRVEVEQPTTAADGHPVSPRLGESERAGGFGLRIVEATSDAWGVEPGPPGLVWFEFRIDSTA
jgi:serine/threonine-protein kinase RsbW